MNRLQKKCVFASAGLHLLLVVILLIGPAFLSSSSKSEDVQVIDFIPLITTDANMSGGGNPKGGLPPQAENPTPPPPKPEPIPPTPQPEKIVTPEPVKPAKAEPVKPVKAEEANELEPAKSTKRKIEVNTKLVTRNTAQDKAKAQAEAEAKAAREAAARQQRIASAVSSAVSGLKGSFAPSTSLELRGPGGGGLPYAGYQQAVLSAYDRAWVAPEQIANSEATVTVRVVINRDGTVSSARITKPSGDSQLDFSVQRALERVTSVNPFPEGAKEPQRTFEFDFKARAKLQG
jgi:TonB family protein